MAAGDVFDTTLADSPPTTYSDPVYGTPDFARFIPTDTLDQIQRDQEASAWAEDQRGKIADLWGNYVNQNMQETIQKYTSITPVEGTSLPVDQPITNLHVDASQPQPTASPDLVSGPEALNPDLSGPSGAPTMAEHGQNFAQGMMQAIQNAIPGYAQQPQNPADALQKAAIGAGLPVAPQMNGSETPESLTAKNAEAMQHFKGATGTGQIVSPDIMPPNPETPETQAPASALEQGAPRLAEDVGAAAGHAQPPADEGLLAQLQASIDQAKAKPEAPTPVAPTPPEPPAPDAGVKIETGPVVPPELQPVQEIAGNIGLDLSKPADAARLQAAQDLLSNERLTANLQKAVDKNLANAKPADNALSTRMSDAYALQQEIEKARTAAPEAPATPEVTPPAAGAEARPPVEPATPPAEPPAAAAVVDPTEREAAIAALMKTGQFTDPKNAATLIDRGGPNMIEGILYPEGRPAPKPPEPVVTKAPPGPAEPPPPMRSASIAPPIQERPPAPEIAPPAQGAGAAPPTPPVPPAPPTSPFEGAAGGRPQPIVEQPPAPLRGGPPAPPVEPPTLPPTGSGLPGEPPNTGAVGKLNPFWNSKPMQALNNVQGILKQSILSTGALFHPAAEAFQLARTGVSAGVSGTLKTPGALGKSAAGFFSDAFARGWQSKEAESITRAEAAGMTMARVGPGSVTPDVQNAGNIALRSLLGAGTGGVGSYLEAKGSGASEEDARGRALRGAAIGAAGGALSPTITKAIFERMVPISKVEGFKMLTGSGVSDAVAAKRMNDTFGGQNLQTLARSKNFQAFLKSTFLAPDWGESWLRNVGAGAGVGVDGGFLRSEEANAARKYWLATGILGAVSLEGLNMALNNGKTTFQNEPGREGQLNVSTIAHAMGADPTKQFYADINELGPVGAPLQAAAAGYAQRGSAADAIGNAAKTATTSHFNVIPNTVINAAINKAPNGRPIVSPNTPGEQAIPAEAAAAVAGVSPIGLSNYNKPGVSGPLAAASQLSGVRLSSGPTFGAQGAKKTNLATNPAAPKSTVTPAAAPKGLSNLRTFMTAPSPKGKATNPAAPKATPSGLAALKGYK